MINEGKVPGAVVFCFNGALINGSKVVEHAVRLLHICAEVFQYGNDLPLWRPDCGRLIPGELFVENVLTEPGAEGIKDARGHDYMFN